MEILALVLGSGFKCIGLLDSCLAHQFRISFADITIVAVNAGESFSPQISRIPDLIADLIGIIPSEFCECSQDICRRGRGRSKPLDCGMSSAIVSQGLRWNRSRSCRDDAGCDAWW